MKESKIDLIYFSNATYLEWYNESLYGQTKKLLIGQNKKHSLQS